MKCHIPETFIFFLWNFHMHRKWICGFMTNILCYLSSHILWNFYLQIHFETGLFSIVLYIFLSLCTWNMLPVFVVICHQIPHSGRIQGLCSHSNIRTMTPLWWSWLHLFSFWIQAISAHRLLDKNLQALSQHWFFFQCLFLC